MINAVGREIPEEILEMTGKEVFTATIISTDMYLRNQDTVRNA